jgi:hypothetical protein
VLAKDYVPKDRKFAECYKNARNSLKTAKYDHKQKKKRLMMILTMIRV